MEAYTLDSQFRRTGTVIDVYNSFIWTERYSDLGDFELVVNSTPASRALFVRDLMLAMNLSNRVMIVDSTEDKVSDTGEALLTVKGHSMEKILKDRVAIRAPSQMTEQSTWNEAYNSTPQGIINDIVAYNCYWGGGAAGQTDATILPYLQQPTIIQNTGQPGIISWTQEPQSVFDAIKYLADSYLLGFRMTRLADDSKIYFESYSGLDRTMGQSTNSRVLFSVNLDNLANTTELKSNEDTKTVAVVTYENPAYPSGSTSRYMIARVYDIRGTTVDPGITGWARRELLVKADIQPEDTNILAAMIRQGAAELQKAYPKTTFDGELSQNGSYKYGTNYNLGDLVSQINRDGVATSMRVTEQIFACDGEGERAYPTLATIS